MLLTLVYTLEVALALLVVILTTRTILLSRTQAAQTPENQRDSRVTKQYHLEAPSLLQGGEQKSTPPRHEAKSTDSAQDTLTDYISETLSGSSESKDTVNQSSQHRTAQASPTSSASPASPQTAASQDFIDQMLSV